MWADLQRGDCIGFPGLVTDYHTCSAENTMNLLSQHSKSEI